MGTNPRDYTWAGRIHTMILRGQLIAGARVSMILVPEAEVDGEICGEFIGLSGDGLHVRVVTPSEEREINTLTVADFRVISLPHKENPRPIRDEDENEIPRFRRRNFFFSSLY